MAEESPVSSVSVVRLPPPADPAALGLAGFALIVLDLLGKIPATDVTSGLGWFLLSFAIFNTYMMIWSARTNMSVFLVFVVLEATEIILFAGFLAGSATWIKIGGYVGVADAVIAWYTASAIVANSTSRRTLVPLGPAPWRDPPELAGA